MNAPEGPGGDSLGLSAERRIDAVCRRFEDAWKAGASPAAEAFLGEVGEDEQGALLRELLRVELHYRGRKGERPAAEEYRRRFPAHQGLIAALLGPGAGESPTVQGGTVDHVTTPQGGPAPPEAGGLGEELGRGGMAVVYRRRDAFGRDVATKVIRPGLHGDPAAERRFLAEARVTAHLQHPGVVPVHEQGWLGDGRPYFTMKLVRGRTLAALLADRPGPGHDLPRFVAVFAQVCQAVAYAHSRGVIHRDLKPANVMVGAFGEVQLMDWGLARQVGGPEQAEGPAADEAVWPAGASASAPGGVAGTPAYMAPEQARGEAAAVGRRSDVFGLGAVLCEVLTGKPPYAGGGGLVLLDRAAAGDLADASARLDACGADGELVRLARDCLAAQPGARPADAGVVAAAVSAYQDGVQQRLREAERQRAAAEARAQESGARARAERRARRLTGWLAAAFVLVLLAGGGAWRMREQRLAGVRGAARDVREALGPGRDRLERAWDGQDLGELAAVKLEGERIAAIAQTGGVPAEVRQESAAFQADAEALLTRARQNRALLDAWLDVALTQETRSSKEDGSARQPALAQPGEDEQYAAAFRRWAGASVDTADEAELLLRLRREPGVVRQEVAAGLDAWMLARRRKRGKNEGAWRRLYRLADALDPSDRRGRLRAVLAGPPLDPVQVVALVGPRPPWPALGAMARGPLWRQVQAARRQTVPETEAVLTVVLLAEASSAVGDAAAAEGLLRKAATTRPGEVVLLQALGKVLERQGPARRGEAVECYRAVRALRPRLGVALGQALCRADRAGEGERVFRDLLRRQPDNPDMHFYLSYALGMQKKLAAAEAAARDALRLAPQYADAYVNLGIALEGQGRLDQAEAACASAVRLQPDSFLAHYNLGYVLRQRKELTRAEAALRKAIALRPDYPLSHNELGFVLEKQGSRGRAVDAWRKALRMDPDYSPACRNLGLALADLGQLDEAVAMARKAVRLTPGLAESHSILGYVLYKQGKLDEAVRACREAVRLDDGYAYGHNHLGLALLALDDNRGAEAAFRAAVARKPGFADAHNNLGIALRLLKKLDASVDACRTALRVDPDYAYAYVNLGMALGDLARFKEALAALQQGLARAPAADRPRVQWLVRYCQQLLALDARLADVLGGSDEPADAQEQVAFAHLCTIKALNAAAVRLFAAGFAREPRLADDLGGKHRYDAACAACLAAAGQGKDAPRPDKELPGLRRQALAWLRADLTAWARLLDAGPPAAREAARKAMRLWRGDDDLAGVREAAALGKLPPGEQEAWQKLWADVAALQARAAR
jgi:tetratricopeptide (TPR) repeat protein